MVAASWVRSKPLSQATILHDTTGFDKRASLGSEAGGREKRTEVLQRSEVPRFYLVSDSVANVAGAYAPGAAESDGLMIFTFIRIISSRSAFT